jgi:HlyD family secretion protein
MSFRAKVNQVRLAPEIEQNVVSYNVILEVSNPDLLLKPGMTANVTILVEERDNVLKVPSGALRFHPSIPKNELNAAEINSMRRGSTEKSTTSQVEQSEQNKPKEGMVWILDSKGKPEPVYVKVGITDGAFTQIITDRIKAGDEVITSEEGQSYSMTDNQDVNPFMPRFHNDRRKK